MLPAKTWRTTDQAISHALDETIIHDLADSISARVEQCRTTPHQAQKGRIATRPSPLAPRPSPLATDSFPLHGSSPRLPGLASRTAPAGRTLVPRRRDVAPTRPGSQAIAVKIVHILGDDTMSLTPITVG